MATATQRDRLRADIGASLPSLPDAEADDIFTEAGESYTDTAQIKAAARVIAIQRLLAPSAKLTTYRQNQSSENASDVFKHLKELLEIWKAELAWAIKTSNQSAVKFGRSRRIPRRIGEFPDNDMPRNIRR